MLQIRVCIQSSRPDGGALHASPHSSPPFSSSPLQIRCLRRPGASSSRLDFDSIHIVNHYIADDESYHSSDDDAASDPACLAVSRAFVPRRDAKRILLHPNLAESDSDGEEGSPHLSVPAEAPSGHKTTTV